MSFENPLRAVDWSILVGLTALAAAILGFRLGWQEFWWDEQVTLMFTRESWRDLLITYWGLDTHRPTYYALQKAWIGLVGDGPFAIRLLSLLLTLPIVPLFFFAARAVGSRQFAIFAALAVICIPQLIYQGREIRMYSLLHLSLAAGLCFMFLLMRSERHGETARKPRRLWVGFTLSMVLAFYAQPITLFTVALYGLWVLCCVFMGWLPSAFLWRALIAFVGFLILITPGLFPFFAHMNGTLGGDFWIPEPSFQQVWNQGFAAYPYPLWAKPGVALLILWGFWSLRRDPPILLLAFLLVVGLPLLILAVSFAKPIFIARTIAWGSVVSALVIAAGMAALRPTVLKLAAAAFLVTAQGAWLAHHYPKADEHQTILAFAESFAEFDPDNDVLILGNQNREPVLRWFYPSLFTNPVFGFTAGDNTDNVIDIAYRSTFVPRGDYRKIPQPSGRLFVFADEEAVRRIDEAARVQPTLDALTEGLTLLSETRSGINILTIYERTEVN